MKNFAEVVEFINECVKNHGLGFHPDTDFKDYVYTETGKPVYTPEEAEVKNKRLIEAFNFCDGDGRDIYEVCYDCLDVNGLLYFSDEKK